MNKYVCNVSKTKLIGVSVSYRRDVSYTHAAN